MRCYDEMRHHDEVVRPHYARFERWLAKQGNEAIARKRAEADILFAGWGSPLQSTVICPAPSG